MKWRYLVLTAVGLLISSAVLGQDLTDDQVELFKPYFPLDPGSTWEYSITIEEASPLLVDRIWWPSGTIQEEGYQTTPMVAPIDYTREVSQAGPDSVFRLIISLKGEVDGPAYLESYQEFYEIEVIEDRLGIYPPDRDKIYWGIDYSEGMVVREIITYPSGCSRDPRGEPGPWQTLKDIPGDGFSRRTIFYAAKKGVGNSTDPTKRDVLWYNGLKSVPIPGGLDYMLIFEREVQEDKYTTQEIIEQGIQPPYPRQKRFVELTFFVRGEGMFSLVQLRGFRKTMTWVLEEFTPGR